MLAEGDSPYGEVAARPTLAVTSEAPKHWLRLTGEPVLATSEVAKGQAVLTIPAAHAVTGRLLASPQRVGGVFSGLKIVPAGAAVYAVPLGGKTSWCAPARHPLKKGGAGWSADCFVQHFLWSGIYTHTKSGTGLFAMKAVGSRTASVLTPQVREGPVDFGVPIRIAYTFQGWSKQQALLRLEVQSEGEPAIVRQFGLMRAADGSAFADLLGGRLRIAPAGHDLKSARIEVVTAPSNSAQSPI